jgi:hypothetical protein
MPRRGSRHIDPNAQDGAASGARSLELHELVTKALDPAFQLPIQRLVSHPQPEKKVGVAPHFFTSRVAPGRAELIVR